MKNSKKINVNITNNRISNTYTPMKKIIYQNESSNSNTNTIINTTNLSKRSFNITNFNKKIKEKSLNKEEKDKENEKNSEFSHKKTNGVSLKILEIKKPNTYSIPNKTIKINRKKSENINLSKKIIEKKSRMNSQIEKYNETYNENIINKYIYPNNNGNIYLENDASRLNVK